MEETDTDSAKAVASSDHGQRGRMAEDPSALIMVNDRSSTTVEEIRASFSDETEVTFDGPDTGMIRPVFRDRDSDESYRFLLVPVAEGES